MGKNPEKRNKFLTYKGSCCIELLVISIHIWIQSIPFPPLELAKEKSSLVSSSTTRLCEGRGCGHPAQVPGTHPFWSRSAPMGETSGDPVDGASSLRSTSGTFVETRELQLSAHVVTAFVCLPAAISRSNQRAVLSKWFAINGSGPPSRSSSTNRSWRENIVEAYAY